VFSTAIYGGHGEVVQPRIKRLCWPAILAITICYVILALAYRLGEQPPHASTALLAEKFVGDILTGNDRGTALCRLISLQRYRAKPRYEVERCSSRVVRQLIGAPNGDVFGITVEAEYIEEDRDAPYAGELILFDRQGFLIPVYGGSNVLTSEDGFLNYRSGDYWAIVHAIRTGAGTNAVVKVLSVVPLDHEQRAVLQVIVGAPMSSYECRGFNWSWQARDVDGDKVPDIETGPNVDPPEKIEPRAVFRWSDRDNRYIGPDGSPGEGWLRLDTITDPPDKHRCCPNESATLYAESATNREGVQRPCLPPETFTITVH